MCTIHPMWSPDGRLSTRILSRACCWSRRRGPSRQRTKNRQPSVPHAEAGPGLPVVGQHRRAVHRPEGELRRPQRVCSDARCVDYQVDRSGLPQSCLNLYLTFSCGTADDVPMRRLLALLCAGAAYLTAAPVAHADYTPWFAPQVGNASQVISVVGAGGSTAKVDVFQRTPAGWEALRTGIPAHVGAKGMAAETHDGNMATPLGVYTL